MTSQPDQNVVQWLKKSSLLKHLQNGSDFWDEEIEFEEISVKPGKTIIKRGLEGGSLYVVYQGEVDLFTGGQEMKPPLFPGDFFGELEIRYSDEDIQYYASAKAGKNSDSEICVIKILPSTVERMLHATNNSSLLLHILRTIQKRVLSWHWLIQMSTTNDSGRKLACALMHFFDGHHPVYLPGSSELNIPGKRVDAFLISIREIQKFTGLSRKTTTPYLIDILKKGAIFFEYLSEEDFHNVNEGFFKENDVMLVKRIGKYKPYKIKKKVKDLAEGVLRIPKIRNNIIANHLDPTNFELLSKTCSDEGIDIFNPPIISRPVSNLYTFSLTESEKLMSIAEGGKP